MVTDDETALSFVFKRSGKKVMKISDVILSLSVSLGWFSIDDARAFVNKAISKGLLRIKDKDFVEPTFDYTNVSIPIDFKPSAEIVETAKPDENLLNKIIEEISKTTKKDRQAILDEIESLSSSKCIYHEVAALFLGKKLGVNIDKFFEDVEKELLEKG
jgi:hypothetical protein